MKTPKTGSAANWNPGPGSGNVTTNREKLFGTTAQDAKDTMTGTNELKEYRGGKGVPKGPFGLKGKEF